MLAMQEEAKRLRQLIIEHRRKKCCKDYKTWAYMICVASILIGTIVLIILAGMGIVKVNWKLTVEGSHLYPVLSYHQARQFSRLPNLRYRLRGQMMWPCRDFHLGYIANNDVVMSVKLVIFCPHLAMSGFEPVPASLKCQKTDTLTAQPYWRGSYMGIIKNSWQHFYSFFLFVKSRKLKRVRFG